jgi:hypothetical protein
MHCRGDFAVLKRGIAAQKPPDHRDHIDYCQSAHSRQQPGKTPHSDFAGHLA